MIVIKSDRGWVKPETWEEVESIPGYIRDIDPKEVKLKNVIGSYREPELRVCGLSTCHRKHYKGFIVELESDDATNRNGNITNIGANCGHTHLGAEFDIQSRQIDRDWASQERRETIKSAEYRIDNWQIECDKLHNDEHGASWLIRQNRAMHERTSGLPDAVCKYIQDALRTGDSAVYKEHAATLQEREAARETGQSDSSIIKENIGTLSGLSGLSKIKILREILVIDLEKHLKTLSDIDVETLADEELRFWAKWCGEVDSKIDMVRSIVNETQKFFTRENISLLYEVTHGDDGKQVMRFAKQYD